jgi:hypothetical protein
MAGKKFDKGKAMMDLVPSEAIEELAQVMTFGANKYGRGNWAEGIPVSKLLAAAMRHLNTFNSASGQDLDDESNLSHLAHAATNLLFASWMQKHRPELDDRWVLKYRKKVRKKK